MRPATRRSFIWRRWTRETMRPQDTLARYGGEEFVILLPDDTFARQPAFRR